LFFFFSNQLLRRNLNKIIYFQNLKFYGQRDLNQMTHPLIH